MILTKRLARLTFLAVTPLADRPARLWLGHEERGPAQGGHRREHAGAGARGDHRAESGRPGSAERGAAARFLQGWDVSQDSGAALAAMKVAWTRTRMHWERTEGVIEPMFGTLDESMDSRYEDMVMALGARTAIRIPFDGEGMIGMHAIERILYAPGPEPVADVRGDRARLSAGGVAGVGPAGRRVQERPLPAPGRPTRAMLLDQWKTATIDLGVVFTGLTGLHERAGGKGQSGGDEPGRVALLANHDGGFALKPRRDPGFLRSLCSLAETKPYGVNLNDKASAAFMRLERHLRQGLGRYPSDAPGHLATPPSWRI